jgi:hypothetical protein
MFDPSKWIYRIRVGMSSEAEVKYNQAANAADAAHQAAKVAEKMDKLKAKSKPNTLASKICQCFDNDLTDMLG